MNTLHKFFRSSFALALILGTLTLSAPTAKADVISISPPRFELFGNPGDIVREKLKVRNDGEAPVNYTLGAEDFTAAGDDGGINISDDPDAPRTTFSLAKWLTTEPSSFTVEPGQEKIVDIVVRIPQDGEPGGHYASVQVKLAGSPTAGGGASVESRLNSLILLRVSGNIIEKLSLSSFDTSNNFYQNGPIDFNLRTSNEGNVHVAPAGTIVITDLFNRKVAEVPLDPANVLPESSRVTKATWDKKGMIGRYKATLIANYGSSQQNAPITATTSFTVVPMWLVYGFGGGLVFLILLITKRKSVKKFLNKLTSD